MQLARSGTAGGSSASEFEGAVADGRSDPGRRANGYALVVSERRAAARAREPNEKSWVAQGKNLSTTRSCRPSHAVADVEECWRQRYRTKRTVRLSASPRRCRRSGGSSSSSSRVAEAYRPDPLQRQLAHRDRRRARRHARPRLHWGRRFIRPIGVLTRGTHALSEGRLDERV